MEQRALFRKKTRNNDAEKALQSILEANPDLSAEMLDEAHTEKAYMWKIKPEFLDADAEPVEPESEFPIVQYKKDDYTEGEAIHHAMHELETFETNLKTLHTDSLYRFTKIRG